MEILSKEYFSYLEEDEKQEQQLEAKTGVELAQEKLMKFRGGESDPRKCKTCED